MKYVRGRHGRSRWTIFDRKGEVVAELPKRPYGDKDVGDARGDILAIAPDMYYVLELLVSGKEEKAKEIAGRIMGKLNGCFSERYRGFFKGNSCASLGEPTETQDPQRKDQQRKESTP